MSHRQQTEQDIPQRINTDELDSLLEMGIPINPLESQAAGVKVDKDCKGYRYYKSIQEKLPDWWEEFNGKLDKTGRLKYATIRSFILRKVPSRGSSEYRWLLRMIGPDRKPEEGIKKEVPWLGDWEKRRATGFGVLDNMDKVKPLIEAIKNNLDAAESIKSFAPLHLSDVLLYEKLIQGVLQAFGGKLFLDEEDPLSSKNKARFKAFTGMIKPLVLMKHKISHEWIRVHGVDPFNPHEMRDMVQIAGQIGGAAMLTGIAAGQRFAQGTNGQQLLPENGITQDALLLAQHLTQHAHTFKKPLPVIDAEPVAKDEKQEKTNGKHHVV